MTELASSQNDFLKMPGYYYDRKQGKAVQGMVYFQVSDLITVIKLGGFPPVGDSEVDQAAERVNRAFAVGERVDAKDLAVTLHGKKKVDPLTVTGIQLALDLFYDRTSPQQIRDLVA